MAAELEDPLGAFGLLRPLELGGEAAEAGEDS